MHRPPLRHRTVSASYRFAVMLATVAALLCLLSVRSAASVPTATDGSAPSLVRFQGTALQGIDEHAMRAGGSSLTMQLLPPDLRFNASLANTWNSATSDEKSVMLTQIILRPSNDNDASWWMSCVDPALRHAKLTLSNGGRLLKIVLGDAPQCRVSDVVELHTQLPTAVIATPSALFRADLPPVVPGPVIVVIPRNQWTLQLTQSTSRPIVAGEMLQFNLVAEDPVATQPTSFDFEIIEGPTCVKGARFAVVDSLSWSPQERVLSFRPLLGGTLSVCYSPFSSHPSVSLHAGSTVVVSGPEGMSTEPSAPRAQMEFSGMIYGTNLTDQDVLVLSSESSCEVVTGDADTYDLVLSSPARALFWATVPSQGWYQVCYNRAGSPLFVRVGSIHVGKGSDLIIEKDTPQLLVDQNALVVRNTRISFLTLQQGQLNLDNFQLNVTHFVWTGGELLGTGSVNCMGSNSKIAALSETRVIESVIRNYGTMEIDMRHIAFTGRGALYNFGELVLLVNSSGPEDPATIQAATKANVIINGAHGKITFRFLVTGGSLQITAPIENRGYISTAPASMVIMHELLVSTSATVAVLHYSLLVLTGARVYGTFVTGAESEIRFAGKDAALFRAQLLGDGRVSILSGKVTLDSITFGSGKGSSEFVVDGSSSLTEGFPVTLLLRGTNTFDITSTSMLRGVAMTAQEMSRLIFQGRLICHVPSVTFGSNIVVQSNLAAVMFGSADKEETQRARLVPQRMPQNSSFVVPPNATLVIMDTGGMNQSTLDALKSPPRICSQYVVIPMHVEVDGKVLLWGCAMLPFGATLSGVIYGTNAKEVEATVQYAYCRNVLLNPGVCVPMFAESASGSSVTANGVSVSGPLTIVRPQQNQGPIAPTTSFATAGADVSTPSIDVDYFKLTDGGSLYAESPFSLFAYRHADVGSTSTVILSNGGLFAMNMLQMDGALQVRGELPLVLHGSMQVSASGRVTLDVDTSTCRVPLQITEIAAFHPDAHLRCFKPSNRTVSSAALMQFGELDGDVNVDAPTCVLNGNEVTMRVNGDDHTIALQFVDLISLPSTGEKWSLFAVTMAVALALICLLLFLDGLRVHTMFRELVRECPLQLHLTLPEFTSFAANAVVVGGLLLEAFFLSLAAFHPENPLPREVGWITRVGMQVMQPHRNASGSFFTAFFIVLTHVWLVLWLPLSGKLSHVVKSLLTNPNSTTQRKCVQLLFQAHTCLSFAFGLFQIPVLTHLLDSVACGTFLSPMSSCEAMGSTSVLALASVAIQLVLVPFSAHCINFPFGHPPYNQGLDVRFKRTFAMLHTCIIFLQVAAWKILANDASTLLCVSALCVVSLALLVRVSHPCAYTNINSMRLVSLSIPVWSCLTTWVQILRFGAGSKFVCATGDPLYVVTFYLVIAVLLIALVFSATHSSVSYNALSSDPAIDASMKALTLTYFQIEDLRVEMYNTARTTRREVIANNIARLRIEYLEKLRLFRTSKEKYLLPFYLGDAARGLLSAAADHEENGIMTGMLHSEQADEMRSFASPSTTDPAFSFHDPVKPQITTESGTPIESSPQLMAAKAQTQHQGLLTDPDGDWILTPDEMDRFHCGPQLGRGSYGTVHMGMLPSGRLVAVKVIQIVRKKKDQLGAVKLEVNMLRSLNHPNIIRYYGCHASQGHMYVFMEFAVGGSLTSLVRKFEKLSEPVMRYYTQQILSGLLFLHSRHVVHRDIKGENILIDGHGVAKLADFGCSKALADMANKSQNGCGTLVGSPYWMAPEVIKNEAYGTKADIWSVGCTVVEMLNGGQPPWHEKFDNVYSAMFFIANTTEIPSNIPNDVSSTCRDFLARCFERDVAKRASAAELLQHPWLQDLPDAGSSTSGGSNSSDTPKIVERQWSDMFETDSLRGTGETTNASTRTSTAVLDSPPPPAREGRSCRDVPLCDVTAPAQPTLNDDTLGRAMSTFV